MMEVSYNYTLLTIKYNIILMNRQENQKSRRQLLNPRGSYAFPDYKLQVVRWRFFRLDLSLQEFLLIFLQAISKRPQFDFN